LLEAEVRLQPHVRARAEVDLPPPPQRHEAAAELGVVGDEVRDPERDPLGHRFVDQTDPPLLLPSETRGSCLNLPGER